MIKTMKQNIMKVDPKTAQGEAKELLNAVNAKFGMIPNAFATMATSPTALKALLGLNGTLEGGSLPFELRNEIAILVSELNGCSYCLSAFTAIGKSGGIKEESLHTCRMASSEDPKIDAGLKFVRELMQRRGAVGDDAVMTLRNAGYDDEGIGEIIANVAMMTFVNYF